MLDLAGAAVAVALGLGAALFLAPAGVSPVARWGIGVLLAVAVLYGFRLLEGAAREETPRRAGGSGAEWLAGLREGAADQGEIQALGTWFLEEIAPVLGVDDAQLTLYYDQPFALEATHIRRLNGRTSIAVERVSEMEPWEGGEGGDDTGGLTPATAAHSEMLICRERLVGILMLGGKRSGEPFGEAEKALLSDVVPIITLAADHVMMLRSAAEANEKLLATEKLASIGQLATGIAHEMRNPLTSMKMNLQGLGRATGLSDRDRRRVQISLDEIERLNNIVGDLMNLARRTPLNLVPIDLDHLFRRSLRSIEAETASRKILVETECEKDLPEIRGDEDRLMQALINLILNAAQALEEGGRITLRAERYGAGVELQVSDTGPGIPKPLQRDIFNPFFTTKAGGTGLGLANVHKIAQEHGGEVEVSSEEGVGTTFFLRLPPEPPSPLEDPAALRVLPT